MSRWAGDIAGSPLTRSRPGRYRWAKAACSPTRSPIPGTTERQTRSFRSPFAAELRSFECWRLYPEPARVLWLFSCHHHSFGDHVRLLERITGTRAIVDDDDIEAGICGHRHTSDSHIEAKGNS